MLLDRHRVEVARNFVAFIFRRLEFRQRRAGEETLQLRSGSLRHWRAAHLFAYRVDQPESLLLPELGAEPETILPIAEAGRLVRSPADGHLRLPAPFLVVEPRSMQANRIIKSRDEAVRVRHQINCRALVRD